MILYLDECYNTGNNWNDENQLFFTYGGWLVSEENLEKAKSIVRLFANNYQGELKSKSFASHKGIKKVINLSKDLISEGNAVPFFMCFEKKFMIACKAVEIFFYHKTNCKVNGYLTFPNEYEYFKIISKKNNIDAKYEDVKHLLPPIKIIKMALAETIYTDEKLCSYIGDVINNKNIEENCVDNIINQMANLFNEQGLEEIAQIFKSENFSTDEIYEELIGDTLIDNTKVEKSKKSILVQHSIFEMTQNIIDEYKPDAISVEELFFNNNAKTAINVAQARGVILVVGCRKNVPTFEYTPLQIKQSVVGYGRADKIQVQKMVKTILGVDKLPKVDDTTDSMAAAICHAHSSRFSIKL